MRVDYGELLYDPVYAELGVDAVFTAAGTAGEVAITVIDDTRPKTAIAGSLEVRSVGPGAFARIPELAGNGIARDDYVDAASFSRNRTSPRSSPFGLPRSSYERTDQARPLKLSTAST